MLTSEQKKTIAVLLKIKEDDFNAALTATEEVALAIPEGITALLPDELTRVKTSEYTNGKTAGAEMAVKEAKDKLGIDFAGKSVEGLVEAANKKALAEAKITPDVKVVELQKDIELLKTANATLTQQVKDKETLAESAMTDREIFQALPTFGENAISVDKVLKLMRADGYEFKMQDGKLVPMKGGEVMKDATANILNSTEVIKGYAKENRLVTDPVPDPKGRGGGDGGKGPAFVKLSEVEAHFKAAGKSTNGQEFNDKIMELTAANKDFDLAN